MGPQTGCRTKLIMVHPGERLLLLFGSFSLKAPSGGRYPLSQWLMAGGFSKPIVLAAATEKRFHLGLLPSWAPLIPGTSHRGPRAIGRRLKFTFYYSRFLPKQPRELMRGEEGQCRCCGSGLCCHFTYSLSVFFSLFFSCSFIFLFL